MGAPMARNVAAAGLDVVVWDRTREKAEAVEGATVADSPAGATDGADFMITMLSDGAAVESAAPDALREGLTWLQMSTVGLDATERLMKLAEARGVTYIDAPVSGTKEPAEKGALIVLASGDPDAIARARPIFDAVAAKVIELGAAGEGQRLKLVANTWVVAIAESTAETFAFAEALGVDPRKFLEVIEGGPLDVGYARAKGELILKREFPPSFPLRLALKDVRLVQEAAREAGMDLPLAEMIARQFERAAEDGHGDEDLAATWFAVARDADVT
ncbi:MAG: 3-hydroxyisobutyrate dehydrogenase [Thermoleophilales bacterium]|nr:3-hydroxyisobutyrate dehydrogenase [Thermoleophilales bacterium]